MPDSAHFPRTDAASDFINDANETLAAALSMIIADARERGFWRVHRAFSALEAERDFEAKIRRAVWSEFQASCGNLPAEHAALIELEHVQ